MLSDENMNTENITEIVKQIVALNPKKQAKAKQEVKKTSCGSRHKEIDENQIIATMEDIATLYRNNWEKNKLEFAKELISRTWAGIPIPALSICGFGTAEIRYSSYLAYYLDYAKPHGLGTRYLDAILNHLHFDKIDTYHSVVDTEKYLGTIEGHKGDKVATFCDIVIECTDDFIFIENKINSSESKHQNSDKNQLRRYNEAISSNHTFDNKNHIKIYLTPSGKKADKNDAWNSLSYDDLITLGLNILREGGLSGVARENLKRFLMDLSLGPKGQEENEIENLTRLAEEAIFSKDFGKRIRFDLAVSKNQQIVSILMEG